MLAICLANFLVLHAPAAQATREMHRVGVVVRVDTAGRAVGATARSGNSLLFERAVEVAKSRRYTRDCDERGVPVPSTTTVFVQFDQSGQFVRIDFPIVVGWGPRSTGLLKRVQPFYPRHLKRAGVEGEVILSAHIDRDGRVTRADVLRGHPLLAEHAAKAVLHWRYAPTYFRCDRVPVIATVVLTFRAR